MRCTSPASCDVWGCVPGTFRSEKRDPNPQPLTTGQQAILDAVPRVDREMERLFAACVPQPVRVDPRASTSAVSTSTAPATLSLASLEKALADIPPEPIGEWMREQGFPPETSLAILPLTMRGLLPFWPEYVRFSVHVGAPTLARDPGLGSAAWGALGVARYRK